MKKCFACGFQGRAREWDRLTFGGRGVDGSIWVSVVNDGKFSGSFDLLACPVCSTVILDNKRSLKGNR